MRPRKAEINITGAVTDYKWVIFGLLSTSHFLMAMCHFSWGPLGPIIKTELNINNNQFGFIISLMYFSMVVVSIPSGILVDRRGVKWMLSTSSFLVGTGILILPLSTLYVYTAAAAMLIGAGYGMINQITTKGIVSWFELRERGTIMGIKQIGVTIGGGLIGVYIPFLGLYIGWQNALFLLGVAVIAISILSLLLYTEKHEPAPGKVQQPALAKKISSPKESLKEIIFDRKLLIVTFLASLLAFCQACTASFLVVYAKETFALTPLIAGSLLTVAMAGGTIGRIIFGMLSDKTLKGDRIIPLALISIIGSAASLSLAVIGGRIPIQIIFMISFALGISFMGWNSLGMVLLAEMGGSDRVGSVLGIVFTVAWGAMVLGPSVFGYIVDRGGYLCGWWMLAALSLLAFAGFMYLAKLSVKNIHHSLFSKDKI
ncbi:MAG: MFS transporter [Desulfosarcina sp.]|nr:MFS transporter [Desulfobacterales bacterium]